MDIVNNFRQWRRYRNTVSELNKLSTRELNDLGLSRADIEFAARRAVR